MTGEEGKGELPEGWVRTSVGEIYKIIGGGTPSTRVPEYWEGDIPWITSADIHGLKQIKPRKYINENAIKRSATNLIPKDSIIVVTRVGLGKVALTKKPICFSQDSQALIGNKELISPDYSLYYLSEAVQIFKYKHRGTTIAGVTKKQLKELHFPLPPLPEQHRIVAKIETLFTRLDAGVTALTTLKTQLKRYRQAVLKSAMEGKLTAKWREEHKEELEPASELLERIKKDFTAPKYRKVLPLDEFEYYKIPKEWKWVQACDLCFNITNGYTPKAPKLFYGSGEIPFIKVYNLTKTGELDFSKKPTFIQEITHTNELKRSIVKPKDILMNIVGPPLGKISVVQNLYPEWNMNQAIVAYKPFSCLSRQFFIYALLSESVLCNITRLAKATAGQYNLTVTMTRSLPIPLPPVSEQEQIVQEIETRFSVIDHLEVTITQSLLQADRLRHSILKRAFEGKLIPQDPDDEPAEELLVRIKAEKEGN